MSDTNNDPSRGSFWVTCYTDASFCVDGARWGVYLRAPDECIEKSGKCPDYVCDSLEAELSAILAGVYLVLKRWGREVRGIFVRSDCKSAIDLLQTPLTARTQRRRPGIVRLRERILSLAYGHGVELHLRWVRGHQQGNSAQAFVNRRCDELARGPRKRKKR